MKRAPFTIEEVRAIIEEKVVGKIEACHSETGHHYKFVDTGVVVDSVTTKNILEKKHLIPWAIGLAIEFLEKDNRWQRLETSERESLVKAAKLQHTDVRDEAGNVGSIAHKIIEAYTDQWIATGEKPSDIKTFIDNPFVDYRVFAAARSAEAVYNKYGAVPVISEILVGVSPIGAGTLDLIVMNEKGELELWDWKTSNSISDYYSVQTAAYKYFFEKMTGLRIKKVRVMKIDKFSDKFKAYNVPNLPDAFNTFKNLSKVYDWVNNGKKKLIEDKIIVQL
jgi:hypothetical protein